MGKWLHGELDADALRTAVQSVVDRHEVLRTVYRAQTGQPYQHILPQCDLPWQLALAEGGDVEARRLEALRIARDEVVKPFALATPPLQPTA